MFARPLHTFVLFFVAFASCGTVSAQSVSDAPRSEYYFARELYEAGRLVDAAEGFKVALSRSFKVQEQPWIDSIPSHVMLGEAYFHLGKVVAAMEHYDAALMIFLNNANWIEQIKATEPGPLESKLKGVNWFALSRAIQLAALPDPAQLSVDVAAPGVGQPTALSTKIDAAEILRTLGLALLRRGEVLGPLAKHSPLAQPLTQLLGAEPKVSAPWCLSAWRLLRGFHAISVTSDADPHALIQSNATLNGNTGYFMTPVALVAIGKLHWYDDEFAAALPYLQDATLVAARYEQYSMLAESLQTLSAACCANIRTDLLPAIQNAAGWALKRNAVVQASGFAGAAELATVADEWPAAELNSKQAAAALSSTEVSLPRQQAQLFFANAITAFGQNRQVLGNQNLESALKIMRGTAQDGAVAKHIFQLQMVLNLMQNNALQAADAEQALTEILREPGERQWKTEPLETLAAITTSAVPAYATWLELAERRGTAEQFVQRMDRIHRQRFYESLPLGGRLFSWRYAVASDPQQLPPAVRETVARTLKNSQELTASTRKVTELSASIADQALPLEERHVTAEAKRLFAEYAKAIESHENLLLIQSLRRQPLDRVVPFQGSLEGIRQHLNASDLMLGFVISNGKLYGVAISRDQVEMWSVADAATIESQIKSLLVDIGHATTTKKLTPEQVTAPNASWVATASKLSKALFPAAVQSMVAKSNRILVVPDGGLWYLPFELLPTASLASPSTWLGQHPIVYLPSLGSIKLCSVPATPVKRSLLIAGTILSSDKNQNEALSQRLLSTMVEGQRVDYNAKAVPPAAAWSRVLVEQLVITQRIDPDKSAWDTALSPFDAGRGAKLSNWVESPGKSPAFVMLPGYQTAAAQANIADGRELLVPACALLYSGTHSALLSRWSVGGRSSQVLLSRYLQELLSESPSAAWQRSVAALWVEQFPIAEEPSLLNVSKQSPLVTGQHPKLWSGYLILGDSQSPAVSVP